MSNSPRHPRLMCHNKLVKIAKSTKMRPIKYQLWLQNQFTINSGQNDFYLRSKMRVKYRTELVNKDTDRNMTEIDSVFDQLLDHFWPFWTDSKKEMFIDIFPLYLLMVLLGTFKTLMFCF